LDPSGQTIIQPFASDADDFTQGNGTSVLNDAGTFNSDNFVDVPLDIGAIVNANLDKTQIIAFGNQLFAGATYSGPAPDLLLDSVTFTGSAGLQTLNFTTDEEGFAVLTAFSAPGTEIVHH
jgi:hypothetical protein